jgi:hypothetical protein
LSRRKKKRCAEPARTIPGLSTKEIDARVWTNCRTAGVVEVGGVGEVAAGAEAEASMMTVAVGDSTEAEVVDATQVGVLGAVVEEEE